MAKIIILSEYRAKLTEPDIDWHFTYEVRVTGNGAQKNTWYSVAEIQSGRFFGYIIYSLHNRRETKQHIMKEEQWLALPRDGVSPKKGCYMAMRIISNKQNHDR